jgi:ketosteroid isomerase-like protein
LGRYKQTKHNFSDLAVTVEGDLATCTFTGQATHVKENGERWTCGGDYTYRFARTPQGWKATAARFDMKWEQGTR